jgi:hypothetical protein
MMLRPSLNIEIHAWILGLLCLPDDPRTLPGSAEGTCQMPVAPGRREKEKENRALIRQKEGSCRRNGNQGIGHSLSHFSSRTLRAIQSLGESCSSIQNGMATGTFGEASLDVRPLSRHGFPLLQATTTHFFHFFWISLEAHMPVYEDIKSFLQSLCLNSRVFKTAFLCFICNCPFRFLIFLVAL